MNRLLGTEIAQYVRIKTEETFSNLSLEREREREKERNDKETHFFDRLLVLICELEGITQLRARHDKKQNYTTNFLRQ